MSRIDTNGQTTVALDSGSDVARRVMLIGWDAADWRIIDPLLQQGKMPALARLIEGGVRGNLATIRPVLSPMLWTSIATGKRPFKHGIHGFTEPTPAAKGIRPVTNLSRKTKALWNILSQQDKRSIAVGWWPSHPAEPINGVMVSNHYQRITPVAPRNSDSRTLNRKPMLNGTVHPNDLVEHLEEFRFDPRELTGEHLRPFVPNFSAIDQDKDQRLMVLAKIIAETTSIQGATTALMQLEEWDFLATYFDGIDHFCHGFMRYHPPRLPWVPEAEFEMYKNVIEASYRFHDMILGTLISLAGPDTIVILMSDHGFRSDHLRLKHIPAEPAGPAAEHRDFGIVVMAGPGVKSGEVIHGSSVLDITPTILHLLNLPIGRDMDGKPLLPALDAAREVRHVDSWDSVEGNAGRHPDNMQIDPTADAEAMKQLVDLGYIEQPDEDAATAVAECTRELQFNLAQSYADAGLQQSAAKLYRELWSHWPREHRFGIHLVAALGALGRIEERRGTIELLDERAAHYAIEARKQLQELRSELEQYDGFEPSKTVLDHPPGEHDAKSPELHDQSHKPPMPPKLMSKWRRLSSLAASRAPLIGWLRAAQAVLEGDSEAALRFLAPLQKLEPENPYFHNQIGMTLLRLKRYDEADRSFQTALRCDPENAAAFAGLAESAAGRRQWEQAVEHALGAVELQYFNPRVHSILGRCLIQLQQHDAAEKALLVTLAQAPQYVLAHRLLAVLYRRRLNQPGKARHHLRIGRESRTRAEFQPIADEVSFGLNGLARVILTSIDPPFDGVIASDVVTVVTGLPRSGTSMMMQMLQAGGIELYTDGTRTADTNNERGYFEHEDVKRLISDQSWLEQSRGKAVKIITQLLPHLPKDVPLQVICMERDLREVVASQRAMLEQLGRDGAELDDQQLMQALNRQLKRADEVVRQSDNIRCLHVRYSDAVRSPKDTAARLAQFFGGDFDIERAASAIDPTLRRNVANATDTAESG